MHDEANPKDAVGALKTDLSLVPPASLIHEAKAMENGAKKYGPFNWRTKKVRARVYVAAGLRHLLEYLDGADFSTDTSPPVHHLAHAKACMGIVLDAMETGNLIDDRPPKGAATRVLDVEKVGHAADRSGLPSVSSEHDAIAEALDAKASRSPMRWLRCTQCQRDDWRSVFEFKEHQCDPRPEPTPKVCIRRTPIYQCQHCKRWMEAEAFDVHNCRRGAA